MANFRIDGINLVKIIAIYKKIGYNIKVDFKGKKFALVVKWI